jgi:hypothetical protein
VVPEGAPRQIVNQFADWVAGRLRSGVERE